MLWLQFAYVANFLRDRQDDSMPAILDVRCGVGGWGIRGSLWVGGRSFQHGGTRPDDVPEGDQLRFALRVHPPCGPGCVLGCVFFRFDCWWLVSGGPALLFFILSTTCTF